MGKDSLSFFRCYMVERLLMMGVFWGYVCLNEESLSDLIVA
jgi:hypothetical protein